MIYLDEFGQELTKSQFEALAGPIQVNQRMYPNEPGWVVSMLQLHRNCECAMTVGVLKNGRPYVGRKVAWYWPDAPADPMAGVLWQADPANTNLNNVGSISLSMGAGAVYWPQQGQIGPHAVWMYGPTENTEWVLGLGWFGGTNHDHVDVYFEWYDPTIPQMELLVIEAISWLQTISGQLDSVIQMYGDIGAVRVRNFITINGGKDVYK